MSDSKHYNVKCHFVREKASILILNPNTNHLEQIFEQNYLDTLEVVEYIQQKVLSAYRLVQYPIVVNRMLQ
jgi:hypothetical protein